LRSAIANSCVESVNWF